MDAKQRAAEAARVYQDFDPQSEVVAEQECDTLIIYLPGDLPFPSLITVS